jgi:predicted dehydrogenase
LAKNEKVDLVVSCIRVDSHASSVIPSILAGKDVYVEWPLEANLTKATELAELAQKHKVRNITGLQSSFTPLTQQLKSIVQSGRIGRVVSSHNITCDRDAGEYGKATVKYFKDREVGGNPLTIYFGHAVEYMTEGIF